MVAEISGVSVLIKFLDLLLDNNVNWVNVNDCINQVVEGQRMQKRLK